MKIVVEQSRNKLAKERSHMSSFLEEMEELRLIALIQEDHRFCTEEKQQRVDVERKDMAALLAKALEDQTVPEDLLIAEQERADVLFCDLAMLQEHRWTTEKI